MLEEAGSSREKLLSATVYLRDMVDFAEMNAVWEQRHVYPLSPEAATMTGTTVPMKPRRTFEASLMSTP